MLGLTPIGRVAEPAEICGLGLADPGAGVVAEQWVAFAAFARGEWAASSAKTLGPARSNRRVFR